MIKNIISTIFTKGFVAIINLALLLISSNLLGSNVRGQISLLILNIAIIQLINEIFTGYSLVYFIPKSNLKKIYSFGIIWSVICTVACTSILMLLFYVFNLGINQNWIHLLALSFIIILHSFHGVIILSREKIKIYNLLNFFQPFALLLVLLTAIFAFNIKTINSYVVALYISFGSSLIISSYQMYQLFKNENKIDADFKPKHILQNGFYNQLANLSHMLSNRYNFYLLGNTVLVGVFSSSSSLIESIWIISSSVSPIILTHIANSSNNQQNSRLTLSLAKVCFAISFLLVVVLFFIPSNFFTALLSKDFSETKTIMLYLSPGILSISFSTIISHYFAGQGKQKVIVKANVLGLATTMIFSPIFISNYKLIGACYATSLSYFVSSFALTYWFLTYNKISYYNIFKFRIKHFYKLILNDTPKKTKKK